MKVEKGESKFQPVAITLESQEELDLMTSIIAKIPGRHVNRMAYSLYDFLLKAGGEQKDFFVGSLKCSDYLGEEN